MTIGADEADRLAAALAATDFDAVERDDYRAAWTEAGDQVVVEELATGDSIRFNAEDLIRAESDAELRNAREHGAAGEFR